jgi:TRAP-type C4-dicarboxylate transport system permease small subunit
MPSDADRHRRAPPREDRAAPSFYVRAMGWLYVACIAMGAVSIVAMTGLIFTGVIMRYFFQMGAQFAEPMAIFFAVQLTMYGAAACYRAHAHLRLGYFVGLLPDHLHRAADWLVHALMAAVAVAMIWYGLSLTVTTWFQAYPEFDYVRVGVVYSGIPGSGLVLLLFVIEAVLWPSPHANPEREEIDAALAQAETVQNRLRR